MTQTSGKNPHRRRCRRGAPGVRGGEGKCLIPFLRSDSLRRSQPRVLHPVVITGTDGGAGTGSAQPADANRCQFHFPRHMVLFLNLAVFPLDPRHSLLDLKVYRLHRAKQYNVLPAPPSQKAKGILTGERIRARACFLFK